jgi:hypothetical protein
LEGVAAESTVPHQVLAWDDVHLALMSAGGTLRFVPWRSTDDLRRVSGAWQPLTPTEVAAQLAAEFGDAYQIRGSAEFLVVQPRTAQRDWARSMQQFYGNIQTYCAGRQIRFQAPRFPLVAIVLPNRQTMLAYAARRQEAVRPHFLAYYGLNTNRIVMVDPSSPRSDSRTPSGSSEAALNLETVFHETFHQVAFNSGLHRRTLPPPLWVSEGMATAFETAGMADHQRSRTLRDRLHRTQCQLFKDFARRPDFGPTLASLIASDELFQARPTEAYAIAWAMAFYWMEQSPQAFSDYLERLKRGATFTVPSPQQRESDFQALSRCTLPEFQQRLINYYDRLP